QCGVIMRVMLLALASVLIYGLNASAIPTTTTASMPATAASHITAVTVYQGSALVTRAVAVPAGGGGMEVLGVAVPAETVDSSLYSEGDDGLRVLSTRFRSRALKEDNREEVRKKENEIKARAAEAEKLNKQVEVVGANLALLGKLENFTGATMQTLAEK